MGLLALLYGPFGPFFMGLLATLPIYVSEHGVAGTSVKNMSCVCEERLSNWGNGRKPACPKNNPVGSVLMLLVGLVGRL